MINVLDQMLVVIKILTYMLLNWKPLQRDQNKMIRMFLMKINYSSVITVLTMIESCTRTVCLGLFAYMIYEKYAKVHTFTFIQ